MAILIIGFGHNENCWLNLPGERYVRLYANSGWGGRNGGDKIQAIRNN